MSTYLHDSYDTHRTYGVNYIDDYISTTVTHTSSAVDAWINETLYIHRHRLHKLIVGLDIEWRPSFNRNITNPAATLQLCVGRRCLILQLIYAVEFPQSLVDFLTDDDFTFVGVRVHGDIDKLQRDYNLDIGNGLDLSSYAAEVYGQAWMRNAGLKSLAMSVLGKEVDKPKSVTLSRWDNQWLSLAQVHYACVDAFLSFEIGNAFESRGPYAGGSSVLTVTMLITAEKHTVPLLLLIVLYASHIYRSLVHSACVDDQYCGVASR